MINLKASLFIFLLFTVKYTIYAQQQNKDIDAIVSKFMKVEKVPGTAIAIVKKGEPVYVQTYGLSNIELGTPVTNNTVFELASLTKQMTAALAVALAEKGKISLNDTLSHYVENAPENWDKVTLKMLLGHMGGFIHSFEPKVNDSYLLNYSKEFMLEACRNTPMLSEPGTDWKYSDQGYFLAGVMIEAATDIDFNTLMIETFFKPMGMENTIFLDQDDIILNRAAGYIIENGEYKNNRRSWEFELTPHFGVMSTINDMVLYEKALHNGTIITKEVTNTITAPYRIFFKTDNIQFSYGMGWEVQDTPDRRVVKHSGYTGTAYIRDLKTGLSIIILTNRNANSGTHPFVLGYKLAKYIDSTFPDME